MPTVNVLPIRPRVVGPPPTPPPVALSLPEPPPCKLKGIVVVVVTVVVVVAAGVCVAFVDVTAVSLRFCFESEIITDVGLSDAKNSKRGKKKQEKYFLFLSFNTRVEYYFDKKQ